jgi:hypothetical protein
MSTPSISALGFLCDERLEDERAVHVTLRRRLIPDGAGCLSLEIDDGRSW